MPISLRVGKEEGWTRQAGTAWRERSAHTGAPDSTFFLSAPLPTYYVGKEASPIGRTFRYDADGSARSRPEDPTDVILFLAGVIDDGIRGVIPEPFVVPEEA